MYIYVQSGKLNSQHTGTICILWTVQSAKILVQLQSTLPSGNIYSGLSGLWLARVDCLSEGGLAAPPQIQYRNWRAQSEQAASNTPTAEHTT